MIWKATPHVCKHTLLHKIQKAFGHVVSANEHHHEPEDDPADDDLALLCHQRTVDLCVCFSFLHKTWLLLEKKTSMPRRLAK